MISIKKSIYLLVVSPSIDVLASLSCSQPCCSFCICGTALQCAGCLVWRRAAITPGASAGRLCIRNRSRGWKWRSMPRTAEHGRPAVPNDYNGIWGPMAKSSVCTASSACARRHHAAAAFSRHAGGYGSIRHVGRVRSRSRGKNIAKPIFSSSIDSSK